MSHNPGGEEPRKRSRKRCERASPGGSRKVVASEVSSSSPRAGPPVSLSFLLPFTHPSLCYHFPCKSVGTMYLKISLFSSILFEVVFTDKKKISFVEEEKKRRRRKRRSGPAGGLFIGDSC